MRDSQPYGEPHAIGSYNVARQTTAGVLVLAVLRPFIGRGGSACQEARNRSADTSSDARAAVAGYQ